MSYELIARGGLGDLFPAAWAPRTAPPAPILLNASTVSALQMMAQQQASEDAARIAERDRLARVAAAARRQPVSPSTGYRRPVALLNPVYRFTSDPDPITQVANGLQPPPGLLNMACQAGYHADLTTTPPSCVQDPVPQVTPTIAPGQPPPASTFPWLPVLGVAAALGLGAFLLLRAKSAEADTLSVMSDYPNLGALLGRPRGYSGDVVPADAPPTHYAPDGMQPGQAQDLAPPPPAAEPFPWGSLLLVAVAAGGLTLLILDHNGVFEKNGSYDDEDEEEDDDEDEEGEDWDGDEGDEDEDEDEQDVFGDEPESRMNL